MEVLDGTTNVTNVCASSSHQYPLQVWLASGALVNNNLVICGGVYPRTSSCYKFSHDHQWKSFAEMKTPRSGSASIPLPNGLWVTGGFGDGGKNLKSTEFVFSNGTSSTGPPLPEPRAGHCLLKYKETIFLIGGFNENKDDQSQVWIFRDEGMKFVGNGPSMNHVRLNHACGIYQSPTHDGNPMIVVAGGNGSPETSEYWQFTVPGSNWKTTSKSFAFLSFSK